MSGDSLDDEFPLGDATADTGATVTCPTAEHECR
jgi:hypothetical protein